MTADVRPALLATPAPLGQPVTDVLGDAGRVLRFTRERRRFVDRRDDVYIASYPRSGTTWLTYACWLLLQEQTGGAGFSDVDDDAPPFDHLGDVAPWFERTLARGHADAAVFNAQPGPRVFKTHLVPRWLPSRGRVVVAVRDVADVALSYWRLYRTHLGYRGSLEAFAARMGAGRVQYGAWADHVAAWTRTDRRQVLVVAYEDMRRAPDEQLDRIAAHLDVGLDDEARRRVLRRCSRAVMKRFEGRFDHATSPGNDRPDAEKGSFIGPAVVGAGAVTIAAQSLAALRSRHKTSRRPGLWAYLR